MNLTDEQWALLEPFIPVPSKRGRPPRPAREVLNGILWILRTGAPWHDLPDRFPPHQTCHRTFQKWVKSGVFEKVLAALAQDLQERGKLDLSECYIDGMFVVAKKGDGQLERPSGAKVAKSWQWQTVMVFLSPYTLRVLSHTKSPLLKRLSKSVLQRMLPKD